MSTINFNYFVDDKAKVHFYVGCKTDEKYPKTNPLKIDNYFHLADLLKHIDDDNTYRPTESHLYNKMKMDGSDLDVPVHRTYAFLEDHGCKLVGANHGQCCAILGSAIEIKLAELKYSKIESTDLAPFKPILEIGQQVMFTFKKDCDLHCFEAPKYYYERVEGDNKMVSVEEVLIYLKKLNKMILYLIRYYQDFDMLSAYVQIQNMEVAPE